MGLPTRTVEFKNNLSTADTYVYWDNILYRPDLFPPMEHTHPEITQEIFNNLIQIVETVPSNARIGQLFFIRK